MMYDVTVKKPKGHKQKKRSAGKHLKQLRKEEGLNDVHTQIVMRENC